MFSKRRNELFNDPNKESLFDFPDDLIKQTLPETVDENKDPKELYSIETATHVRAKLASSCDTLHTLFQPTVSARHLIDYILRPDEKAKKEIIKIAQIKARIIFYQSTKDKRLCQRFSGQSSVL